MKRGFTLVEILVVISIISLLSSTIYTSTNEVKSKAKMAAVSMQEEQKHKLMSLDTATSLTFNTTSATDFRDVSNSGAFIKSGSGNILISNDVPIVNDNFLGINPPGAGQVGNDSTSNVSVDIPNDASIISDPNNNPSIGRRSGSHTVSLMAKFDCPNQYNPDDPWNMNGWKDVKLMETIGQTGKRLARIMVRCNLMYEYPSGNTSIETAYFIAGPDNAWYGLPLGVDNENPLIGLDNNWHNYTYTYDDSIPEIRTYFDGRLVYKTEPYHLWGLNLPVDDEWVVGSVEIGGANFSGLVDDVIIYDTVLPPQ